MGHLRLIVSTFIISLAVLIMGGPVAQAANSPDVLVAHRGFGETAQVKYKVPENSIPAWSKAIQLAERPFIVDLDVQWTKDGKLAVMHDRNIKRTTNGNGNVDEVTLDYIKTRWLELPTDNDGNGNYDNTPYRPPSLNQALDFLAPKTVNGVPVKITLEMKGNFWSRSRVDRLEDVLRSKGLFTARVNVHSFNNMYAKYAKEAGFPNVGYVAPSAGPMPSVAAVKAVGGNVFIKHTLLTPAKLNEYNNAGVRVWVWTVDTDAEFEKVYNFGRAYAWVTNDLVEAQDFLAEKEAAA